MGINMFFIMCDVAKISSQCGTLYKVKCVFLSPIQDSRPTLISAVEECVYNFLWLTAAACPLNSTQHDDCRVTNPATGQTSKQISGSVQIPFDDDRNRTHDMNK